MALPQDTVMCSTLVLSCVILHSSLEMALAWLSLVSAGGVISDRSAFAGLEDAASYGFRFLNGSGFRRDFSP